MESEVESSKPNRMKDHMEHIKSFRGRMYLKVSPNLSHPSLHPYILTRRNPHQDLLQVWNVLNRKLDRETLPVQDVTERRDIMLRDENRNTPGVDCLHHPGASHLIPTWAKTELALPKHVIVRNTTLWKVLLNLNVLVLVFPILKKNGPYVAM